AAKAAPLRRVSAIPWPTRPAFLSAADRDGRAESLAEQRQVALIVKAAVGDQSAVPHALGIASQPSPPAFAAGLRSKPRHQDAISAVLHAQRMKRLMQITDEVNEELQGNGAIGTIERNVSELRCGVGDAIDGAIAPPIGGRIFREPRLART